MLRSFFVNKYGNLFFLFTFWEKLIFVLLYAKFYEHVYVGTF